MFRALDAAGVAAMWRMLCARGKDLAVVASDIEADDSAGRAHWVATYTYSATGRRVENRIDAAFAFRDGLIARHVDRFDLWRWLRQALGVKGALLGWLPPVQGTVRAQAAKALGRWRRGSRSAAGPSQGASRPPRGQRSGMTNRKRGSAMSVSRRAAWKHGQPRRVGVLFSTWARRTRPRAAAVRRYLAEFLSDRRVVEIPGFLWKPILHLAILRVRPARSAKKIRDDLGQPTARRCSRTARSRRRC